MARRKQHTVSLFDEEKDAIDELAGDEGFSTYTRRKLLQLAKEKKLRLAKEKKK